MSNSDTKHHILISAINAIEKYGLADLTTRLIAEEAGVNNAALHYYFGTKENLVDAALNQTARHMLEDTKEIVQTDAPIEARLRGVLVYLLDGIYKFPNIIRAHMTGPLFYKERQSDLLNLLESWVGLTADAVEPYVDPQEMPRVRMHLNMIFSQILMTGLFNYPATNQTWMDFKDPEIREKFLSEASRLILGS